MRRRKDGPLIFFPSYEVEQLGRAPLVQGTLNKIRAYITGLHLLQGASLGFWPLWAQNQGWANPSWAFYQWVALASVGGCQIADPPLAAR